MFPVQMRRDLSPHLFPVEPPPAKRVPSVQAEHASRNEQCRHSEVEKDAHSFDIGDAKVVQNPSVT